MPARRTVHAAVKRLQALADQPAEQAAHAVEVLDSTHNIQAVRAAVDALRAHSLPASRPALLRCYAQLDANGVKRDVGGDLRAGILAALRPLARPDDVELLERAASTYEYLPPNRSEEAGPLRSAAIVSLNLVDAPRAAYHAVRLLDDAHTSKLSGEPALTAARVLASQDQVLPLYYYVLRGQNPVSEVVAECFKHLTVLPETLLPDLYDRYKPTRDEVVLAGLCDLALGTETAAGRAFLETFLRETQSLALYGYVATDIIANNRQAWLPVLIAAAGAERDRAKLERLAQAFALKPKAPALQAALQKVRTRLKRQERD